MSKAAHLPPWFQWVTNAVCTIRHAAHNAIVTRAGSQVIPKTIFASAFSACVSHYIQDMRVNRYTVQLWIKIHDQIARRGVLRCARKIPLGQLDAIWRYEIEILGRITKPRQFRSNHVDHFRIGYIAHWNVGSVRFADIVPDTRNFAIANLLPSILRGGFPYPHLGKE
ncbi:MAG: hypothetical protein ACLS7Z_02745 [Christensenellales bacterium]